MIEELAGWLADPAHWTGPAGIPVRVAEHVGLSLATVATALLVAGPIGAWIGHTGRGALVAIAAANVGRAVPSYALLLMLFPLFGLGFATAFPALVLLAIPPILTNLYTGLREVDRDVVETGRGMGMTEWQLFRRIELPLALPVAIAGLRTAAVQVVATATLAALVAGGGLGRFIVDGFAIRGPSGRPMLLAGALLVALLAILTERTLTIVERRLAAGGAGTSRDPRATAPGPGSPARRDLERPAV